jgi:hypothetical protein
MSADTPVSIRERAPVNPPAQKTVTPSAIALSDNGYRAAA